jgi:hypothetical protein
MDMNARARSGGSRDEDIMTCILGHAFGRDCLTAYIIGIMSFGDPYLCFVANRMKISYIFELDPTFFVTNCNGLDCTCHVRLTIRRAHSNQSICSV